MSKGKNKTSQFDAVTQAIGAQFIEMLKILATASPDMDLSEMILNTLKKSPDHKNDKNTHGTTIMHIAALHGYVNAIKELSRLGADINAQDTHGNTPLDLAIGAKNNTVPLLRELGAKTSTELQKQITSSSNQTKQRENNMSKGKGKSKSKQYDLDKFLAKYMDDITASSGESKHLLLDHNKATNFFSITSEEDFAKIKNDMNASNQFFIKKVQEELTKSPEIATAITSNNETLLMKVVTRGADATLVQNLLKNGTNPDAIDNKENTALYYCIREDRDDLIPVLLDSGADINIRIKSDSRSPYELHYLHIAAQLGNPKCIIAMHTWAAQHPEVKFDLEVKFEADHGSTPLFQAAAAKKLECVKTLQKLGANINAQNNDGNTILHYAVTNKNKFLSTGDLLPLGADMNIPNKEGKTPKDLLQKQIAATQEPNISNDQQLNASLDKTNEQIASHYLDGLAIKLEINAGVNQSEEILNDLKKYPLLVKAKNASGSTLMHIAANHGYINVIKALAEQGANIHAKNILGKTPLDLAEMTGNSATVEEIQKIAEQQQQGKALFNVLNTITETVPDENLTDMILKAITENHYLINARNDKDQTLMHFAAQHGYVDVINALAALGADINAQDSEGTTPFHYSLHYSTVLKKPIDCSDTLIDLGIDATITNNAGKTALEYINANSANEKSRMQGLLDITKQKLSKLSSAPNINTPKLTSSSSNQAEQGNNMSKNKEIVQTSSANKMRERQALKFLKKLEKSHSANREDMVIEELRNNPALQNAKNAKGETLMHLAALYQYNRVIGALALLGADTDAPTNDGSTPLHYCMKFKISSSAETLITLGANPSILNNEGKNCLEFLMASQTVQLAGGTFKMGKNGEMIQDESVTPQLAIKQIHDSLIQNAVTNSNATKKRLAERRALLGPTATFDEIISGQDIKDDTSLETSPNISSQLSGAAELTTSDYNKLLENGMRNMVANLPTQSASQVPAFAPNIINIPRPTSSSSNQAEQRNVSKGKATSPELVMLTNGKIVESARKFQAAALEDLDKFTQDLDEGIALLSPQQQVETIDSVIKLISALSPELVKAKGASTGKTLLHYCASIGAVDTIKDLVEKGADIDAQDGAGDTPLHIAFQFSAKNPIMSNGKIDQKNSAAWILLTSLGADSTIKNKKGETYEGSFISTMRENPAKLITNHPQFDLAKFIKDIETELGQASFEISDISANKIPGNVSRNIQKGMNIQVSGEVKVKGSQLGPQALASINNDLNTKRNNLFIKKITEKLKTSPEIANSINSENGVSLLHLVIEHGGSVELVEELIGHGANVNAKSRDNKLTPLNYAVECKRGDLLPVLKKHGVNIDEKDGQGRTPLIYCAATQIDELIPVLLGLGAKVDETDNEGKTALHYLISHGKDKLVSLLLTHGADVNFKENSTGQYYIHAAAVCGYPKCLTVLHTWKDNKVDINVLSGTGFSAAHLAAAEGHNGCLATLKDLGANLNVPNMTDETPLHMAIYAKRYDTVEELLRLGADATAKNRSGRTYIESDPFIGLFRNNLDNLIRMKDPVFPSFLTINENKIALRKITIDQRFQVGNKYYIIRKQTEQKIAEIEKQTASPIQELKKLYFTHAASQAAKSLSMIMMSNNPFIKWIEDEFGITVKDFNTNPLAFAKNAKIITDKIAKIIRDNSKEYQRTHADVRADDLKKMQEDAVLSASLEKQKQNAKEAAEKEAAEKKARIEAEQKAISAKAAKNYYKQAATPSSSPKDKEKSHHTPKQIKKDSSGSSDEDSSPSNKETQKTAKQSSSTPKISQTLPETLKTAKRLEVPVEELYKVADEKPTASPQISSSSGLAPIPVAAPAKKEKPVTPLATLKARLEKNIGKLKTVAIPEKFATELLPDYTTLNSPNMIAILRNIAQTASVLLPAVNAIDLIAQIAEHPETPAALKEKYKTEFVDLFYPYRNELVKQTVNHPNGALFFTNDVQLPEFIEQLKIGLSPFAASQSSEQKICTLKHLPRTYSTEEYSEQNLRNIIANYDLCIKMLSRCEDKNVPESEQQQSLEGIRFSLLMLGETMHALIQKPAPEKSKFEKTLVEIGRSNKPTYSFAEVNSWLATELEEIGYGGGAINVRNDAAHGRAESINLNAAKRILNKPEFTNIISCIQTGLAFGKVMF
jgi:ankyrin repeat protein